MLCSITKGAASVALKHVGNRRLGVDVRRVVGANNVAHLSSLVDNAVNEVFLLDIKSFAPRRKFANTGRCGEHCRRVVDVDPGGVRHRVSKELEKHTLVLDLSGALSSVVSFGVHGAGADAARPPGPPSRGSRLISSDWWWG